MPETTAWVPHTLPKNADDDNPGYHGLAWRAQQRALRIVRDVHAGTFALQDGGYLRQFPLESDAEYADRVEESVLFNAVRSTVRGWTGMVYRKDPMLTDHVPDELLGDLADIDLAGRDLATFGRDGFHDKELDGHTHYFVDWHGEENPATLLEEDAEARPYAVHILKEQITRFRPESRGGNTVLSSFAYIETEVVRDGEFAEQEIERTRQYDLVEVGEDGGEVEEAGQGAHRVRYRSWTRKKDSGDEWEPEEEGVLLGPRMDEIPLVTDYADRTGFMTSNPPAEDLAQLNLRHFRLSSDKDESLHKVLAALFVLTGIDAEQVGEIVTDKGLALPDEGMDAKYVEAEGNGLSHARDELQDLEQRMQALGLQALVQRTRGQRTATEQRMEKAERDSDLSQSAKAHQSALDEVIRLMAKWRDIEIEADVALVEVNVDFDTLVLDPQMVTALEKLVPEKMSLETFWDIMVQGEVFPETFDPEVERERIGQSGVGELQAFLQALRDDRGEREEDESDDPEQDRDEAA